MPKKKKCTCIIQDALLHFELLVMVGIVTCQGKIW